MESGSEEPDEQLLLLSEPAFRAGPSAGRAAPGGAVRLCGEPGPEEEEEGEEDSGPEGDGEEEPLLRASGRGRRAGAARDKEPRVGAGTAAAAGLARGERRGAPGVCPEGWTDGRTDGRARPDLAQPSPAPRGGWAVPAGPRCSRLAMPAASAGRPSRGESQQTVPGGAGRAGLPSSCASP